MKLIDEMSFRDKVVVGSLTTLATTGCCLLFYWTATALFLESPKVEALIVVLLVLTWLIYTFGSVAFKVFWGTNDKHFVNIISLIILNLILTVSVVLVIWIFLIDEEERNLWRGIDFIILISFMSGIALFGWAHIVKRLKA